jgi:hypothetical protein
MKNRIWPSNVHNRKEIMAEQENNKIKLLISDMLVNFKGVGRRVEVLSYYPRRSAARAFGLLTCLSAGSVAFESRLCSYSFENFFLFFCSLFRATLHFPDGRIIFNSSGASCRELATFNPQFIFIFIFPV